MIEQKVGWCENGGGAGNFEKRVNFGVLFESESAESTKSVVLMCVSGKHRRGLATYVAEMPPIGPCLGLCCCPSIILLVPKIG